MKCDVLKRIADNSIVYHLIGKVVVFFQFRILDDTFLSLTLCSCAAYPLTAVAGVGIAWYFFRKEQYGAMIALLVLPLCNFFVAVVALLTGY